MTDKVKAEVESCTWTLTPDPDCEVWKSDCGEEWQFTEEGPTGNRMKFCCYCGKPLVERVAALQAVGEEEK